MSVLTSISQSVGFDGVNMRPELNIKGQVFVLNATQIAVSDAGTRLRIDWPRISGATAIELDHASVTLLPPEGMQAGTDLGHQRGAFSGDRVKIPIPLGPRPVRSLYIAGLRLNDADATALNSYDALAAQNLRLAVAVETGGVLAPVSFAVPWIGGQPSQEPFTTPPLLAGAWFDGYRLSLPDVSADALWLMVVSGNDPQDFAPVSFALDYVSARAAPAPVDISLSDPEGAVFFNAVGPVTAPMRMDAKNAVQRALERAISEDAVPRVDLSVSSRVPGKVGTYGIVASGQIKRVFDDKIVMEHEGLDQRPALPGAPLETRGPISALADIAIEHHGLRLHESSDAVPSLSGGQAGQMMSTDAPVWTSLPPQALRGERLRRVGLIGMCFEATELSLRVLNATPQGTLIAPPDLATATLSIEAPDLKRMQAPDVFWFDLGEGIDVQAAIGVEVSVVQGRLLWIEAAGAPQMQMAVAHEVTDRDMVWIGGSKIALSGARSDLLQAKLRGSDFAAEPLIRSPHFATITLSRLTLGYAP